MPYTISRNSEYSDTMFIVFGQLELGQSELNNQPEIAQLTISGYIEEGMATGPIIINGGNLILNNGIVLEENHSGNYTAGGIRNMGSILMNGGVIQNNKANYRGAGIYNENMGHIDILGEASDIMKLLMIIIMKEEVYATISVQLIYQEEAFIITRLLWEAVYLAKTGP